MKLGFNELLTAAADHLDADANVVPPVLDFVPQGQAYPFIVLSLTGSTGQIIKGPTAVPVILQLDVYSTYEGWMEPADIMSSVATSLVGVELTLGGGFSATLGLLDDDVLNLFAEKLFNEGEVIRHGTIGIQYTIFE